MILFVGPYHILSSPNRSCGGIDSHSRITVEFLREMGRSVVVICWDKGIKQTKILKKNKVIFIILPKGENFLEFLKFLFLLRYTVNTLIEKKHISLLLIQSISYLLLVQRRRVRRKASIFVHGIMFREYRPRSYRGLAYFVTSIKWITISSLEYISYLPYKKVILINDEMKKFFRSKNSYTIRNSVSNQFIDSVKYRPFKEKIFLCVGSVIERKRQLDLIKLFVQSGLSEHGWRLYLVGNAIGRYGQDVQGLGRCSDGVEIFQNTEDEQLLKFYKEAAVFCLISDSESSPISIQEAMYSGCKIIATDVGGVSELASYSDPCDFFLCSTDTQVLDAMYQCNLDFVDNANGVHHKTEKMRDLTKLQLTRLVTEGS